MNRLNKLDNNLETEGTKITVKISEETLNEVEEKQIVYKTSNLKLKKIHKLILNKLNSGSNQCGVR